MTIEERAHELVSKFFSLPSPGIRDRQIIVPLIIEALREQVEDCAKVADRYEQEERATSKEFAIKRATNIQAGVAQATHAMMSVLCGRIGKDIRTLGGEK